MKISEYQRENIRKSKIEAIELYKKGLSLRKVAKIMGKTHYWVWEIVKEMEKEKQK